MNEDLLGQVKAGLEELLRIARSQPENKVLILRKIADLLSLVNEGTDG